MVLWLEQLFRHFFFNAEVLYKGQMICNSETTYMMTPVELGKRQRFWHLFLTKGFVVHLKVGFPRNTTEKVVRDY